VIFKLKSEGPTEKIINIPFNHLNDYMRSACNACSDFTNIFADISFGGLGSPDKYTTVITRTQKGKEVFTKAIDAGIITRKEIDETKKKKMLESIIEYSKSKVSRKERFMQKLT